MIEPARRHLSSAGKIQATDPTMALAAAYDAARKACAALLETQGLRATSRGGHIALREAIMAQFAGLPGTQPLAALDRLRRRRNAAEYLEADIDEPEAAEAAERAAAIVAFAADLVARLPAYGG
jgi:hypothetical protein